MNQDKIKLIEQLAEKMESVGITQRALDFSRETAPISILLAKSPDQAIAAIVNSFIAKELMEGHLMLKN